ncbi:MAG TPA: STAS domain-containing protein [Solirubrobacteraceae bacterium]|jgi:anti-anti-sigma factor
MTGSFDETIEFGMWTVFDDSDVVHLVLSGELDIAVAAMLGERLTMLRNEGHATRLDLTELDFIDSSGLHELILARSEARSDSWRLDIDPHITEPVRRAVELAGVHSHLWPNGDQAKTGRGNQNV